MEPILASRADSSLLAAIQVLMDREAQIGKGDTPRAIKASRNIGVP
jgi:hypothetical protein